MMADFSAGWPGFFLSLRMPNVPLFGVRGGFASLSFGFLTASLVRPFPRGPP